MGGGQQMMMAQAAAAPPPPPADFEVARASTIQHVTSPGGTPLTYDLPSLPDTDTAILVLVAGSHGSLTAPTCTHNQSGSAFTDLTDAAQNDGSRQYSRAFLLAPGAVATPSGTFTISVAGSGPDELNYVVVEIGGAHATPLEQADGALDTSWESSGNAVAVTVPSDYSTADNLVFSWHLGRCTASMTVTEPGSTTLIDKRTGTTFGDSPCGFAYEAVASTTKVSHTWTHSANGFGDGVAAMVVLKAA